MSKSLLNRPLRILLVTNALVWIARYMLGPIYALYVEEVGGDLLDAGLTGAVFALSAGLTVLVSANYADKIRESKSILAIGYAAMGIGFLLYLFVDSMATLLMVQVIIGFGEAFYSPAFDSLYSSHLNRHKRARQWGVWEAMFYFTSAGGAAIGAYIASSFGFHALFYTMAGLAFASSLYIFLLPRKTL